MMLPIFDLKKAPIFPSKFQVNWLSVQEKVQYRFSKWQPSWISDLNNFSYLLFTSHHYASYQVSSQLAFWFRRRSENKRPMGHNAHLLTTPRGLIGRIYVRDYYTLLHTKYISCGPHGFREMNFLSFSQVCGS